MSITINTRMLVMEQVACAVGVERYQGVWGDSASFDTLEDWTAGCLEHLTSTVHGRNHIEWMAANLLWGRKPGQNQLSFRERYAAFKAEKLADYSAVVDPAYAARIADRTPPFEAWKAAGADRASPEDQAAYEAACAPIDAAYEAIRNPARETYDQTCAAEFARLYWLQQHGLEE